MLSGLLKGARASLRAARGRALVVGLGLGLAGSLPVLVALGVADLAEGVRARARTVPLVVGAPGAATDLVLGCLYYRGSPARGLPLAAREDLLARGDLEVVPMVLGPTAQGQPVVGVDVAWFGLSRLEVAAGRLPGVVGEVVLGASLASSLGLGVGSELVSDPPERADFVGPTSMVLDVVGVLQATGTPDDGAVFTDLNTAWLLSGELHGHAAVQDEEVLPGAEGEVTEASAAVFLFERLSAEERARVHGHGATEALPISGLLVFPRDQRAHDQVLADLLIDPDRQVTRPVEVVERVLEVVLQVRAGVLGLLALVGLGCLGLLGVVLRLDWRLRAEERALVGRMGGPRWWVPAQMALELAFIGVGSTGLGVLVVLLGRRLVAVLMVGA